MSFPSGINRRIPLDNKWTPARYSGTQAIAAAKVQFIR